MTSRRIPRLLTLIGVAGLAVAALAAVPGSSPLPQPAAAAFAAPPAPTPRYRSVTHEVAPGETAGSILHALGAPEDLLAGAHGQLNRLSVGDRISLDYAGADTAPWRLRLEHGVASVVEVIHDGGHYTPETRPIPYTIRDGVRGFVVTPGSSLWAAATGAGLDERQIGALADIFEYDVDFNTEIQPNDAIRLVAESLVAEDGTERVGEIRAAELTSGKKTFTAIRYVAKDGTVGWYAPDGTGRRRPFLRSPLAFSKVTSGFTLSRYHPILKYSRPHLGVDLGAPMGTPVRAVGDGVVEIAGPHGGHGNFVQIDHEGPYDTGYAHLSRILVHVGQKVHQGDVIGLVGMTGLATGPHLHYEFHVDGRYQNPMTVDLPMTGSLATAEQADFFKVRDAILPMLEGAPAAAALAKPATSGTADGASAPPVGEGTDVAEVAASDAVAASGSTGTTSGADTPPDGDTTSDADTTPDADTSAGAGAAVSASNAGATASEARKAPTPSRSHSRHRYHRRRHHR